MVVRIGRVLTKKSKLPGGYQGAIVCNLTPWVKKARCFSWPVATWSDDTPVDCRGFLDRERGGRSATRTSATGNESKRDGARGSVPALAGWGVAMNVGSNVLRQDLAILADAFNNLGRGLLDASRGLVRPGQLPASSLLEEIGGLRRGFDDLKAQTYRLAASLGVAMPTVDDLNSLEAILALLDRTSDAEIKNADRAAKVCNAVKLLDRVLRLEHTQITEFLPLFECQGQARLLRDAVAQADVEELAADVLALAEADHPFAYLLALVDGVEDVSDDLWETLFEAVGQAFGRPLSAAVARGKIVERAEISQELTVADDLANEQEPASISGQETVEIHANAITALIRFDKAETVDLAEPLHRKGVRGVDRPSTRKIVPKIERLETVRLMASNVISGFVFTDANNNGLFEKGETPIAADTIQLVNSSGTVVGTTTTDANGAYAFTVDNTVSTTPLTITKTVTIPATSTNFEETLNLPQFDPALGSLTQVDLSVSGTLTSEISAENTSRNSPATIASVVSGMLSLSAPGNINVSAPLDQPGATFDAAIFDGAIDYAGVSGHDFGAQSAGISKMASFSESAGDDLSSFVGTGNLPADFKANATSTAEGGGNLMASTTSTAQAEVTVTYHYLLNNELQPGSYKIVQSVEPPGTLNGLTSSNGTVLPYNPGPGPDTIPVTIPATTAGVTLPNNNFGELLPADVSGFVYNDANDNGLKSPGEPGIGGVSLALSGTNDLNQQVNATATTAADGSYDFPGLRPGVYTVTETTEPAGYFPGLATRGNVTPIAGSNLNEIIPGISVAEGQTAPDNDFGKILPVSISGFVYRDINKNGLKSANEPGFSGIPVSLTGTNDLNQAVSLATATGAGGAYGFTNLRPGVYTVSEPTAPKGYTNGLATEGNVTPIPGSDKSGLIAGINLSTPGSTSVDDDFGKISAGVPGGQTIGGGGTPATPPPQVVNVYRLGIHHQLTSFVVQFSAAVDPVSASNPANYRLVPISRTGQVAAKPITIVSAVYNASTHAVTLTPSPDHLNIHIHDQLTITGVKSISGALIDGKVGGAYVTIITKANDPYPIPTAPKPNAAAIARWARRYPRLAQQWSIKHTPSLPS